MTRILNLFMGLSFGLSLMASQAAYSDDGALYDEDAKVSKRVPPIMPAEAETSGYCCVMFDVRKNGQTTNIHTPYCTDSIFSNPSKTAVSQWRYTAAKAKGKAVKRRALTTNITFRLAEYDGRVIPHPKGYLQPRINPNNIPPAPKLEKGGNYEEYWAWQRKYYNMETPCGELIS